jgi:hypothetical protein
MESDMSNTFKQLGASPRWQFMVAAARKGLEGAGWKMERKPGRGLSNTWIVKQDGKEFSLSIRTSQDRWVAFPPLEGGKRWKTLDDVEKVLVSVVDDKDNPTRIQVYLFDAAEVRKRFRSAYQARTGAGHIVKDNYGFWVNLDADDRGLPVSVGAGLADDFKPVANYSIAELIDAGLPLAGEASGDELEPADEAPSFASIGDVVAWARAHISTMAGVPVDAVKLELKIQY